MGGRRKESEAGQARHENVAFPLSFLRFVHISFVILFGGFGMEKRKPHYEDRAPHGFVEDCRMGTGNGENL